MGLCLYMGVDFFFKLNLLPPYLLRLQGDNIKYCKRSTNKFDCEVNKFKTTNIIIHISYQILNFTSWQSGNCHCQQIIKWDYLRTGLVCNLFQDLWNNPLWFSRLKEKGCKKCIKVCKSVYTILLFV